MNVPLVEQRKARNMLALSERYYGKRDLLAEWEEFVHLDPDYVRDLRHRLRRHYLDLTYRGADGFHETKADHDNQ